MPGFVHREQVRFRDLDPMGHVNNAVFLTYVESARVAFLEHVGATTGLDDLNMVVARVEIDFRAPIGPGDEVEVDARPGSVGTKSFGLDHELRVGDRVVAEAKTVCVAYDYEREEPIPLPAEWREKLELVPA